MINMFSVIIFLVIFNFIEANDDRNIYTVVSADGNAVNQNEEEIRFAKFGDQELVEVRLYYESLCPGCRDFDTHELAPTVQALHQYLDIKVYPYGNAVTTEVDGKHVIKCQHGPEECYGNMLHACAIDNIKNMTEAILYNACMMDTQKDKFGSNDKRAIECGQSMNIDAKPIMACAKGERGFNLLYQYGQESAKAHYGYVPYPLINGEVYNTTSNNTGDYFKAVCAAFKIPPSPCTNA